MTRRPWTGAELARLARLDGTLPRAVLAERFGRTPEAIGTQLWRLRGRVTPVPPVPPVPPPNPLARAAAVGALAAEIAEARAESAAAPPFKPGDLSW